MITVRTVVVAEASARATMMEIFGGRGAPAGVSACVQNGMAIALTFDDEKTSGRLIDALVEIGLTFAPHAASPVVESELCRIAARGLNEPALDASRIIETYLP